MSKAKTRKFRTLDQHIDFGGGRIIQPGTEVEVKVSDEHTVAIWERLVQSKAAVEVTEMPEEVGELAEESEPPED